MFLFYFVISLYILFEPAHHMHFFSLSPSLSLFSSKFLLYVQKKTKRKNKNYKVKFRTRNMYYTTLNI